MITLEANFTGTIADEHGVVLHVNNGRIRSAAAGGLVSESVEPREDGGSRTWVFEAGQLMRKVIVDKNGHKRTVRFKPKTTRFSSSKPSTSASVPTVDDLSGDELAYGAMQAALKGKDVLKAFIKQYVSQVRESRIPQRVLFEATARKDGEKWQTGNFWYQRQAGKTVRIPNPNKQAGEPKKKAAAPRDTSNNPKVVKAAAIASVKAALKDTSLLKEPKQLINFGLNLTHLTVPQLKEAAKALGQKIGGKKQELMDRVVDGLADKLKAEKPPEAAQEPVAEPKKDVVPPDRELKQSIGKAFDDLLREKFANTGLVPIHDVRAEIRKKYGDKAASHEVFDEALNQMRMDNKIKVEVITDSSSKTADQLRDSIKASVGTLFYLEKPSDDKFGGDVAGHYGEPAASAKPKADDGPKEGDRDANGLVFRNGRWRREDEPAAAPEPKADGLPQLPDSIKPGDYKNLDNPEFLRVGKEILANDKFRSDLADSYSYLKKFPVFQHGIIEIRRMYYEMKKRNPDITIPQLQAGLVALNNDKKLELRILNETGEEKDPEMTIRMGKPGTNDERLGYFIRFKDDTVSDKQDRSIDPDKLKPKG